MKKRKIDKLIPKARSIIINNIFIVVLCVLIARLLYTNNFSVINPRSCTILFYIFLLYKTILILQYLLLKKEYKEFLINVNNSIYSEKYVKLINPKINLLLNNRIRIDISKVLNNYEYNTGKLKLKIWATKEIKLDGNFTGHIISEHNLGTLKKGYLIDNFTKKKNIIFPPNGWYYIAITLNEEQDGRWYTLDNMYFINENQYFQMHFNQSIITYNIDFSAFSKNSVGSSFYDSKGFLCRPGDSFYDSKGYLCKSGNSFYDSKGFLCKPGDSFYDSKGNLCKSGESFYDSKGFLTKGK